MPEETTGRVASITLRAAQPEDEAFLLKVYASVRADELAQVPWTEAQREAFIGMQFAAQREHYHKHNPGATYDLILLDESPAGRLYVARREREFRILYITILPEYRNRGTGTLLVKDLMAEAARAGKPLNIYVESYNPSYRLFERLGFKMIEDTDGVNHLLEWRAES